MVLLESVRSISTLRKSRHFVLISNRAGSAPSPIIKHYVASKQKNVLDFDCGPQSIAETNRSPKPTMPQNVLIIGGTGVIGKFITAEIVKAKSNFGRIVILTSPKTVEEKVQEIAALKENGVVIKTGSLDDEADVKAAYESEHAILRSDRSDQASQALTQSYHVLDETRLTSRFP